MPKPSRRSTRKPAPREVLNSPLLLTLAAGLAVFLAFQYSFELAVITAIAVGLVGWLGWRSLTPAPGARARRPRSGRHTRRRP
jgi:hypothetical protein